MAKSKSFQFTLFIYPSSPILQFGSTDFGARVTEILELNVGSESSSLIRVLYDLMSKVSYDSFSVTISLNLKRVSLSPVELNKDTFADMLVISASQEFLVYLDKLDIELVNSRISRQDLFRVQNLFNLLSFEAYSKNTSFAIPFYEIRTDIDKEELEAEMLQDYYFDEYRFLIDLLKQQSINVLLSGASGTGKTTFAAWIADMLSMRFLKVDCGAITEPLDFFGQMVLVDGRTEFVYSPLYYALRDGGTLILFDEINRTAHSNILFPILDWTKELHFMNDILHINSSNLFFATINVGYQYSDTRPLDFALTNRFGVTLQMHALERANEVGLLQKRVGVVSEIATQIVDALNVLRKRQDLGVDLSTRKALQLAQIMSVGISFETALTLGVANFAPFEARKEIIDLVLKEIKK